MKYYAKWLCFGLFILLTLVPGLTLMCLTLGEFDYIALGERVQAWADAG